MNHLPGGKLAARPLHFIWIADCSGSMSGQKIEQLNFAISEAIPHMRDVANENPNAEVLVRAVKFSDGAQWHVATPTPVATSDVVSSSRRESTHSGRTGSAARRSTRTNAVRMASPSPSAARPGTETHGQA